MAICLSYLKPLAHAGGSAGCDGVVEHPAECCVSGQPCNGRLSILVHSFMLCQAAASPPPCHLHPVHWSQYPMMLPRPRSRPGSCGCQVPLQALGIRTCMRSPYLPVILVHATMVLGGHLFIEQMMSSPIETAMQALGISVEFCAHVLHAFVVALGTRRERMAAAVTDVGASVLSGITLTKFVGEHQQHPVSVFWPQLMFNMPKRACSIGYLFMKHAYCSSLNKHLKCSKISHCLHLRSCFWACRGCGAGICQNGNI